MCTLNHFSNNNKQAGLQLPPIMSRSHTLYIIFGILALQSCQRDFAKFHSGSALSITMLNMVSRCEIVTLVHKIYNQWAVSFKDP